MKPTLWTLMVAGVSLAACSPTEHGKQEARPTPVAGEIYTVRDTVVEATLEASGVAGPFQSATMATKLMGSVTAVLVHEGDVVRPGQVLARIDARDLVAREAQVLASIAEAEAVRRDAQTQAGRMRALYGDSAATRAQLDAAETGLARAEAGVRAAQGASRELSAVGEYTTVRAPFAGVVTQRFVDPGAFASPGTPIVTVQDESKLRVTASVAPDALRDITRGDKVQVVIEGVETSAAIEGVVPVAGNLFAVNALVANPARRFLAGSAATILLPLGRRAAIVVPASAVRREGDLTGVLLRSGAGDETRWVRVVRQSGDLLEIGSGLRAGDRIVLPTRTAAPARAGVS